MSLQDQLQQIYDDAYYRTSVVETVEDYHEIIDEARVKIDAIFSYPAYSHLQIN